MSDSTHTILHSAKRFFTGTALSRLTGLMRDMAMAFAFGTQDAVAAFLVAFRFSHLLRRLLGEGALQTAFIPQFEKLKKEDPIRAAEFFRNICVGLTLTLTVIIFFTILVLAACLQFMELSAGNREILRLTLLMMPGLLFICLFGLNASILQCEKSYFTPSFAPAAFNAIWIAGVILLRNSPLETAMNWLSGFIVIACLFQWLVTLPRTLAILKGYGLHSLKNKIKPFSSDVRSLAKPLMLGIIGVAASQINNALDAVFARYADSEGPAYLWYAIRMQQLPLALFGIALSGALLPPLTRAIKDHDFTKYRYFLEFSLSRSIALMLPLTFAIFSLGLSSVSFIYGRGDFNSHSVIGTTNCLWAYGLGLIPMTIVIILAPAFYAQEDYRTPTTASVYSMALNVVLNGLMVMGLGLGAASVAVATSVSAWVNAGLLAVALKQKTGVTLSNAFWIGTAKVLSISVLASLSVFASDLLWAANFHDSLLSGQFFTFTRQTLLFFFSVGLLSWLFQARELLYLLKSEPVHSL